MSDQVCKVHKEHLVYSIMCDHIFTGNMGEIHSRGHRISALNRSPLRRAKSRKVAQW